MNKYKYINKEWMNIAYSKHYEINKTLVHVFVLLKLELIKNICI